MPFYIKDLTDVWGFWYLQESWNQSLPNTKGWLYHLVSETFEDFSKSRSWLISSLTSLCLEDILCMNLIFGKLLRLFLASTAVVECSIKCMSIESIMAQSLQYRRYRRCSFDPRSGRFPGGGEWQPTPVFLPEKSHRQRSLVGNCPKGHKESDACTHGHTHTHTSLLIIFLCLCSQSLKEIH